MRDLKILHIQDTCTGCGACVSVCPKQCLTMVEDTDGFYYPYQVTDSCVECHLCEKACHIITQANNLSEVSNDTYIFWQKDEHVRQMSSSGGAFSLFAQYVIDNGGIVFGSRYNSERERLEVTSSDDCGLAPLRKSKYVESYVGDSFREIAQQLKANRMVLYCGTPCQAAGLRQYLSLRKISDKKLLLIDFACHGVPTNKLFTAFKRTLEDSKSKVTAVDFRYKALNDKNDNWHSATMKVDYKSGNKKIIYTNSSFYFGYYYFFYCSICLRLSCYNCHQVDHSEADVTIGDFWDIYKYKKELDDNKGISFLKFNDPKWVGLFKDLASTHFVEKLPNGVLTDPYNKRNKLRLLAEREKFLGLMRKFGYKKAKRKYYGVKGYVKYYIIFSLKALIRRLILKIEL